MPVLLACMTTAVVVLIDIESLTHNHRTMFSQQAYFLLPIDHQQGHNCDETVLAACSLARYDCGVMCRCSRLVSGLRCACQSKLHPSVECTSVHCTYHLTSQMFKFASMTECIGYIMIEENRHMFPNMLAPTCSTCSYSPGSTKHKQLQCLSHPPILYMT